MKGLGTDKEVSIQEEISRAFRVVNITVLLIACFSFLLFDLISYRQNLSREAETRGRIIAANTTSSLAFENREDAEEIMSALRADPRFLAAGVYRGDGRLFAAYGEVESLGTFDPATDAVGTQFSLRRFKVVLPIAQGASRLGTLVVFTSLDGFYDRLVMVGLIAAVVFFIALLAGRLVSNFLGRQLASPVLTLTETTRRITDGGDYSVRAEASGERGVTELHQLTDQFNYMLAEIETRDRSVRASEERFRMIFDFAPFGAAEFDPNGEIRRSNRSFAQMLGYAEEVLRAQSMWRFAVREDARHLRDQFDDLVVGRRDRVEMDCRFLSSEQSTVWATVAITVIRDSEGSARTIIGMFRDITREKEAERALRESEENLQDLVYIASHDLQTPVVSLVGYSAQILKQHADSLNERGQFALHRLKANAEHLHKLILSLLDLSRLNTVRHPRRRFSTQQVVEGAIRDLDLRIREADATVEVDPLPDLVGDETRLSSVIRNLLSNALKYGGKRIHVGCEGGVYFVRDDGIGIEPRNLEKVFQAGVRLKAVEVDGVGMGLTFCKKVIAQHGGRIWVESAGKNTGCVFKFSLSGYSEGTVQAVPVLPPGSPR